MSAPVGPPTPVPLVLQQLHGATGIDAIRLAFQIAPVPYAGDRVAALVVDWASMLKQANGDTWEQTMVDGVNAENSYRAARNVEISLLLLLATETAGLHWTSPRTGCSAAWDRSRNSQNREPNARQSLETYFLFRPIR